MTTLRLLPRTLLQPSATNPRKHFDAARQAELRASIQQHGVLQPLIVRTIAGRDGSDGQPLSEIISGERRWRASEGTAAADALPCHVGEYDDLQVLEVQLIENVQRADLHPLEEAEGYGAIQRAGRGVDEIAAAVGMSKAHVYARLRLLGLTQAARAAFFDGAFGIVSALQIARLNNMHQAEIVEHLQHDAAKGAAWTADVIAHQIRTRYTLRLAGAPFDLRDAELLGAAGSCAACPKRSGANPELFDDIGDADTCTDRNCFADKTNAHVARAMAAANARGGAVITGKEAERLLPTADATVKGFLRLDRPSEFALSNKPLRELLPADSPEVTLIVRDLGGEAPPLLVEVMATPYVRKLLADKGLLKPDPDKPAPKPRETKPAKSETKPQPGDAKATARETSASPPETLAELPLDPAVQALVDKVEVVPSYRMRAKGNERKATPKEIEHWKAAATQAVRSVLAAAAVGAAVAADGAYGLPSEGLNRLLLEGAMLLGALNVDEVASLCGLPAPPARPRHRDDWAWTLSDEQAARALLVALAASTPMYEDHDDRDPVRIVGAALDLDLAPLRARAERIVADKLARQLAKLQPPAAKPAAKKGDKAAPPPAARKTAARKPSIKYRDPLTGYTWSGRGLQPKWLKVALASGRKLADFDIAATPAVTQSATPKVTLSPEAAWPFPANGDKVTATMLAAARDHVIATRIATPIALQQQLRISFALADKVLHQLELQKIVGPRKADGTHEVLAITEADIPY